MALINCPDCNKEISDKAVACIHCGCPITVVTNDAQNAQVDDDNYTFAPTAETPVQSDIDRWGLFAMKPTKTDAIIMAVISAIGLALGIWALTEVASLFLALVFWIMTSLLAVMIFASVIELRRRKIDPEYVRQAKERSAGVPDNTDATTASSYDAQREKLEYKIAKQEYRDLKNQARCPRCKSTSLSGHKKGFGIGKAVVGATITGGVGLVAGNIGAKRVRVTCMKCGKQFWA